MRESRLVVLGIILIAGIGGYVLGLTIAHRDIESAKQLIQQLQTESQRLKKQAADQATAYAQLQAQLTAVKTAMDVMKPSENAYELKPNQSTIVADGHLPIGLIGSPTNDSINININGKRQTAATGDVIKFALDSSTNCVVAIQSFDMFRAIVTATCTAAKP